MGKIAKEKGNKKSPANTMRNAQQRCTVVC